MVRIGLLVHLLLHLWSLQDDTQMEMQLHKLEFEIKLQKLTNELQELKRESSAVRSSEPEMHHSWPPHCTEVGV